MSEDTKPSVVAEGVARIYRRLGRGAQAAVSDLDLACHPGSVTVLVGPNGAGKSTTLRLLAGIDRPDRGTVKVFGGSPRDIDIRGRIGFLADGSELFPFLDAAETLEFFGAASEMPRAERRERAGELSERLGLTEYGNKRVRAYSHGMRRRLGFATVLLNRPDVLLLDEPTTGLDPAGMRLYRDIVRDERARGATMIIASHHLGLSAAICDRLVVLRSGRVALDGSLNDIAERIGKRDVTLSELPRDLLDELRGRVEEAGGTWSETVSQQGLEDALLGNAEDEE